MASLTQWAQAGRPITELPPALQLQAMALPQATGLALISMGGTLCVGQTPAPQVLAGLPAWLAAKPKTQDIVATSEGSEAPGSACLLALPLSEDGLYFAIWFRQAAAGDPREMRSGSRSAPCASWLADSVDAAQLLSAVFRAHLAFQKLRLSQASVQLFETVFDFGSEAMWDWNVTQDELFVTAAAAAVLGLPKNTARLRMADLVAQVISDDQPKVQAALNRLLSGHSTDLHIEFRVSLPGGALRWISTRGKVITRLARGAPQRVVSICKDVTQQHIKDNEYRIQTELLAQQARLVLIGEMASIFAHEINQPLAAIAALAAACKRKSAEDSEVRRLVDGIEEQALRGGDIAWRMLDFSRHQRSSRGAVSLAQLVAKIPGWISLQHSQAEIVIDIDGVGHDLPPMYAAPVEIEQVLLNLVKNAMDAGVSNSKVQRVRISAELDRHASQIDIAVADWGCGLPDAELFTKMKSFESSKEQGTGLGLTVCISIVQAHGGRIWATANPQGGTIVHFTVPLFDPSLHDESKR